MAGRVTARQLMNERFPKLAKRTPDSVMNPLETAYGAWRRIGFGRYVIAAALMAYVPIAIDRGLMSPIGGGSEYWKGILVQTGVYILLALGLNVVVGLAGLLDLGYVAFFMLGSYTTALMTHSGAPDQFHFVQWPVWAVIPFALVVAMLAGVAIGLPTLRLRGDYLAIVTLGFHAATLLVITNLTITNGPRGIFAIPNPSIGDFSFGLVSEYYWWYLLIPAILLAVIMIRHLDNSRVGRYWTAIREDEVAASAMGVPVTKMKVLAFVIGASTSGIAGWINAVYVSFISPDSFPLLNSILVLCAVTIGGMGSIAGAALGGIIIITVPEIIRQLAGGNTVFGFDPDTGRIAIFGFLLVVVMIFKPGGLLAARRRRTELHETGAEAAVLQTGGSRGSRPPAPQAQSAGKDAE